MTLKFDSCHLRTIPTKKIVYTFFLQGGNQIIIMCTMLLAARFLTLEEFGKYSFGYHSAMLIATIATMGSSISLVRLWGHADGSLESKIIMCFEQHNRMMLQGLVLVSLIACCFFVIFGLELETAAFFLCVSIFVATLQLNFFVSIGKAPNGNFLQLLRSLVVLVTFFAMSTVTNSTVLVWMVAVIACVYSIATLFFLAGRYSFKIREHIGSATRFYMLQHWLSVLLIHTDIILLKFISTDESIAVYSVALFFFSVSSFGLYAININAMSDLSKLIALGDKKTLQDKLKSYAWMSLSVSSIFIFILVSGTFFIDELIGVEYSNASNIYLILLVGQISNILAGSVALIVNMYGFPSTVTKTMIAAIAIKIFLGLLLMSNFDYVGMAMSSSVANVFWNFTLLYYVWSRFGLNPTVFSFRS